MQQTTFTGLALPIKEQEYVTVAYHEEHYHCPVLWRVMTGNGNSHNGAIGHAFIKYMNTVNYPYAYVYLDRIFVNRNYAKQLGRSDKLLSEWVSKQIWDTYIHEFLHLYFDQQFGEADTYNWVLNKQTGKMVRVNYNFTYARRWEVNERIVDGLATVFTKIFFEEPEWEEEKNDWVSLFNCLDEDWSELD